MTYWKLLQLLRESLWQSYYWHSSLTSHYDHTYVAKRRAECREDVALMFEFMFEFMSDLLHETEER